MPPGFGVAPSTLKHQETVAAGKEAEGIVIDTLRRLTSAATRIT